MSTRPTGVAKAIEPGPSAVAIASAVAIVAWPQNGISASGVK